MFGDWGVQPVFFYETDRGLGRAILVFLVVFKLWSLPSYIHSIENPSIVMEAFPLDVWGKRWLRNPRMLGSVVAMVIVSPQDLGL